LGVIREQATKALVYLQEEKFEDALSPKQLEVWKYLLSKDESSPSNIAKNTGIEITTVRKALGSLLKLGKIKRTGRGPGTRYAKINFK
jgi:DNA-binding MarR family transcriptional regulator